MCGPVILGLGISITLEVDSCIEMLQKALVRATPEIFNSDQGAQSTCPRHTEILHQKGVRISMDGRGRAIDNIFIERLWRSLKYEEVHLHDYESVHEAKQELKV